jgi:photosystem II stability/assembly factor-like uncharacterized protein
MHTNPFRYALLICLASAGLASAQTGMHIQSRSIGNPILIGKDSVLVQASDHTKVGNRIALIDLKTREWKFVNDTDYVEYLSGSWAMKSRTEGILVQPSPAKIFRTTDGWKSMTALPDSTAPGLLARIEVTSTGYVALDANGSIIISEDGIKWTRTKELSRGANPWDANGDVVYVGSGSFDYLSKDGGKTFVEGEYKGDFKTKLDRVMGGDTILFHNDTALIWTTDRLKTSVKKKAPVLISEIWVRSAQEIWVANALGKVHKTLDGGDTWNPVPAVPDEFNSNSAFPTFASGDDLYSWPYGKSKDGGATWDYFMPTWNLLTGTYSFDFRGGMGMMGKSKGEVLFSTDMGRTFTRRDTVGNQDIMAVKILKNGLYLAGDRNGQVFTSADSGETWVNKLSNTFAFNAYKFQASEDEKVIVMSRNGQPVVSIDGGNTFNFVQIAGGSGAWTVKPDGTLIQAAGTILTGIEVCTFTSAAQRTAVDTLLGEAAMDMVTVDANIGYLVAYNSTAKETHVFKTENGWKKSSLAGVITGAGISAGGRIQAIGKDTLFVHAEGVAAYYRSTDGGKTWTGITIPLLTRYAANFKTLKRAFFHNGKEAIFATMNQEALWVDMGESAGAVGIRPVARSAKPLKAPVAWYDADAKGIRLGNLGEAYGEVGIFNLLGAQVVNLPRHELGKAVDARALPNGLYFVSVKGVSGKTSVARVLKR